MGGLVVGSLKAFNIALCCKWWWRLKTEPKSLWAKLIRVIHRLDNKTDDFLDSRSRSGVSSREATWVSDLANGGRYTVVSMRQAIDNSISSTILGPFHWNKVVPLKVACFAWRVNLNRIPTTVKLHRRGISSVDKNCSYCGVMDETTDHLLCRCPAMCSILDQVFRRYGIQHSSFSCVSKILDFASSLGTCPKRRRMLISICYGMFWCT
uniref:Reverse transcriptase zinc-binding domain-containing protein n=1 Tax=Lactuca sativa TaxID=4236 RepID=A0A9R1XEU0_LACSA|nr:hypothetical protein LSAT_V11C500262140 [Lactuca sativa]